MSKILSLVSLVKRMRDIPSPAYDLLPVNVIMPEDKEQFALPMNGKKMNLRKKDFLIFAENFGISRTSANKMIESILNQKQKILTLCETSFLPDLLKLQFSELLLERMRVFE